MAEEIEEWTGKVRSGDRRAVARALSAIEKGDDSSTLLLKSLPRAGHRAEVIGVTGAPGVGKSTLVEKLTRLYRKRGFRVGILAADPTSPFSGGAILGDRIRMQSLSADEGVFIRSMATRGHLGGLAAASQDAVAVLEAAGYDFVLVETVGVGQAEVEVAGLADTTLLVLAPGMGDDVQTFKAGVMEIADVFVINKADHAGVERTEEEILLSLKPDPAEWQPPIVRTVATTGQGVEDVERRIAEFRAWRERSTLGERRVREKGQGRRSELARERILKLHHVGIAVESLREAIPVFEKLLGAAPVARRAVEDQKVRVAVFRAGESRIELIEASSPDSPVARFIAGRGPGIHHLAISIPDLEPLLGELAQSGIRLVGRAPRCGGGEEHIAFLHPKSTAGALIELVQEQS